MGRLAQLSSVGKVGVIVSAIALAGTASGFSLAAASSSSNNGGGGSAGAPPQPVIGKNNLPTDPTNATTASFTYTDTRPQVNFYCSLDNASFSSCPASGISYSGLGNATHTFKVEAQSGGANSPLSSPATYSWTVANQPFRISGSLTTPLAPGVPPQPLNLQVANPYTFAMKVTSITVSLTNTSKSDCVASANYAVTQYTGPSFTLNAGASESLMDAGATTAQLPKLQMVDLSTNQDSCQGATVNLSYSGTATTP